MESVPPPTMDWDSGNIPEAWKKFKQHLELMFKGPLKSKSEPEKCAYLLLWIGEKGRDVYNAWESTVSEEEKKKLATYYTKFSAYVTPKSNPVFSRYKFYNKCQDAGESFDHFVTELKLLVKDCAFEKSDEMVRDRIVFGTNSPVVREKLINKGADLTLDTAIDIARTHELSQSQLRAMSTEKTEVHRIKSYGKNTSRQDSDKPSNKSRSSKTCPNCGSNHEKTRVCPARGKKCNSCHKYNHFAKVCRSTKGKKVHTAAASDSEDSRCDPECKFFVETVGNNQSKAPDQVFTDVNVGSQSVSFKLDTGAQVNVLPLTVFQSKFPQVKLQTTNNKLYGYSGKPLDVKGMCTLPCSHKSMDMELLFYVVSTTAPPVLGLRACMELKLIELILSVKEEKTNIVKEFADVFDGLGLFPGKHTLKVDPSVSPVIHPPRRVPHALRDSVKKELDRMESLGVISKVTEATDWVNSMVIVEKPNNKGLRICLDPKDLNRAVKREHYRSTTLEEVTAKLSNARYFSRFDCRSGYWMIKLDDKSALLTTFNTPFGRYKFHRLPFGLHSSQDVFQKAVDEALEGLKGVDTIADDILVYGSSIEEHDQNLRNMLQMCRTKGIKLNGDKSVIRATELQFYGNLITSKGLQPDPLKVAAIADMEPPNSKKELETVLGMINYLSKFLPNLAEVTHPLRSLLKEKTEFTWDSNMDKVFRQVKSLLTEAPVLAYYDVSKDIEIQADASQFGLGAVLLQDGKPIAYASRSLSQTEQNYAQIEKELYAIVFGCEKFHQYVYGKCVHIQSDHKPLESIMKKPLMNAPARLQRMMLRLQKYNVVIMYKPGKDIPVADALSRKPLSQRDDNLQECIEMQVHTVMKNLPVSDAKLTKIKMATQQDEALCKLGTTITTGWPNTKQMCPIAIQPYWNYRDELSLIEGILFKGDRIIIPASLQGDMLRQIHQGHLGIEKCRLRARQILFWPNINRDIEKLISSCGACQRHRPSNTKEPLMSHEIPDRPWQTVGTDLFDWDGSSFLLVVDYYSRYVEIERLRNIRSATVIKKTKAVFSRHGIPEKVISDNGPCYSSREYATFAEEWDFKHVTSSPRYPKSNGLSEKFVQTVKRILTKSKETNSDPYLGLLELRCSPVDGYESPAQLLMSRNLRSVLPSTTKHLQPKVICPSAFRNQRECLQKKQQEHYNKSSVPLNSLTPGQAVHLRNTATGQWEPASVQSKDSDRSYTVQTPDGGTYRRNRVHLRESAVSNPSAFNAESTTQTTIVPSEENGKPLQRSISGDNYRTRSGRRVQKPECYKSD